MVVGQQLVTLHAVCSLILNSLKTSKQLLRYSCIPREARTHGRAACAATETNRDGAGLSHLPRQTTTLSMAFLPG